MMDVGTCLVTGGSGFVGCGLLPALTECCGRVVVADRVSPSSADSVHFERVEHIGPATDWGGILESVDCVIHLAARVHVMDDRAEDPLSSFREVNVEGTRRLAEAAAEAGVRRFVFLSSIKVNGEVSNGTPVRSSDPAAPLDPYGVSKWEAEQVLHRVAEESGLELVVLRPPLVYGPGVKGNLQRLLRWIDRGVPLPFARVRNRRSLIALGNLVSAILLCLNHPDAAGKTYLISDGEDLSTADLIRHFAAGMGRNARLLPVPLWLLHSLLWPKPALRQRLLGDLQVDSSPICRELGWRPPFSPEDELRATGAWFRQP